MRKKSVEEYNVCHYINITKDNDENTIIASTSNIVTVQSYTAAKALLDDATPKGDATFIIERSNNTNKHIYIEKVLDIIIKHQIIIKKHDIECVDTSSIQKSTLGNTNKSSKKPKEKSNTNKTHKDKKPKNNINKKDNKSRDSKSYNKKSYTRHKNKSRTKVDIIDYNKIDDNY